MNSVLVIRGGAIGDFILTLPAIKLLRDQFPQAKTEILGYPQIIVLAENRFYADAIHSIESRLLTNFFSDDAILPPDAKEFFAGFDLIVSYVSDPHNVFQNNLKGCGIKLFLTGSPKLNGPEHAAVQLARPLEEIGLHLKNPAARIYPNATDREFARDFLAGAEEKIIGLHPGSGSATKNWPIAKWKMLGEHFLSNNYTVLVIAGEADEEPVKSLESAWNTKQVRFARNLALPYLAALLEGRLFVGHDSGISHLAAAVGAQSILLFGPTDPAIWAPANENVTVLRAPSGNLRLLTANKVIETIDNLAIPDSRRPSVGRVS
jgi:heptosyltransferase-3